MRANRERARIGILFADSAERLRCADHVAKLGHEPVVATPAKAPLEEWTGLSVLIADAGAAERRGPDLQELKDRSAADFRYLPLVIALPIRTDFTPWSSFGFDDLICTPIQREALRMRIGIWLRLREEAERHYRSLVEGSAIGIYRTTPDGRILYVNPALARMIGASVEGLLGRDLDAVGFQSAQVRTRFRDRIERDGQVTGWEATWTRADGTLLHVKENALAIGGADGRILYYEGTVEDVTSRVAVEERLAAIHELGRTLVLTRNEREICQATVGAARDVLGIEDCELFLIQPSERRLVFSAHAAGPKPFGPLEFSLDADHGIMAAVARTGEAICLSDVAEDPRYIGGALRNRSELCVPVKVEDQVLGVLNAESPLPGRFGPAERQLLEVLATQAAVAIANARLFAEARRLEAFNEGIVQGMSDGILIEDSAGTITFANPALGEMIGYRSDELIGQPWQAIVPPEHWDRVTAEVAKRPSGVARRYEIALLRKDQRQVPVIVSPRPLFEGGRFSGVLTVVTDITALRESEQALRSAEQQLRSIVEHSTNMFYAIDTNHVFTYVSPQSRHILGCDPEEAMRRWTDFVTDNPINTAGFEATERAIVTGQPQPPYELEFRTKQGKAIWVEVREAPVVAGGQTIAVVGSLTDITERKQAEQALQRSEARYRELVEEVSDVIFSMSANGVVTYVSPASAALSGYSPTEIVGQPYAAFIYPDDLSRVSKGFYDVLQGQEKPFEYRVLAKSGDPIWVRGFSKRFFEGGQVAGMRGVLTDISARKKADEERERNHKLVQDLSSAIIHTLSATVALRDPYTAEHQRRVAELVCAIGRELGLPAADVEGLRITALVHDIGKTAIPMELLSRPGKLRPDEMAIVQAHALAGYNVLKETEFPWPVAATVLQHHERLDGSGYPQGLAGEAISLWARILAVADVVEAMASHRPYRPARGLEAALAEVEQGKGRLYDPQVVEACRAVFEKGFTLPPSAL
jgi:PAS domain S-box-containing protein/putative nucleotidyltransferase with HDIG domain